MYRVFMLAVLLLVASSGTMAQSSWNPKPFQPTQGMWWSSDEPGTGVAFNIDHEGRWFAAIYLYDEDGAPTFLTMQGETLDYMLGSPNVNHPYLFASSPLIASTGGQCLRCPWRPATATDTGDDATLIFYSRTKARLEVGDWTLDLMPLPQVDVDMSHRGLPEFDRHYAMIIEGEVGQHVATVVFREDAEPAVLGNETGRLECVDCRTVDAQGAVSGEQDDALRDYIESIVFRCVDDHCQIIGDGFVVRLFSDVSGLELAGYDAGDTSVPPRFPTRIEFRKLKMDWRP